MRKPTFELIGYYYNDSNENIQDTQFCHAGTDSLLDHQNAWFNEAIRNGYSSGELDVFKTIKANTAQNLSEIELIEIRNDRDLMDTPLNELFDNAISKYRIQRLKAQADELEDEIIENRHSQNIRDTHEELNKVYDSLCKQVKNQNNRTMNTHLVTLVRTRSWESAHWFDYFIVKHTDNPEQTIRDAVAHYLQTDSGQKALVDTSDDFNWGDAVMQIPEEIWTAFNITCICEDQPVSIHNATCCTIMVDQDELLTP